MTIYNGVTLLLLVKINTLVQIYKTSHRVGFKKRNIQEHQAIHWTSDREEIEEFSGNGTLSDQRREFCLQRIENQIGDLVCVFPW
jgi:hypothetical protein